MSEHWESHWWSTTLMNHAPTWLYRYMYIFLSTSVNRERAESHVLPDCAVTLLKAWDHGPCSSSENSHLSLWSRFCRGGGLLLFYGPQMVLPSYSTILLLYRTPHGRAGEHQWASVSRPESSKLLLKPNGKYFTSAGLKASVTNMQRFCKDSALKWSHESGHR